MKIQFYFKTPDAVADAVQNLSEDDTDEVNRHSKRWIEWGEAVTLELDTEAGTCEVLPVTR